MNDPFPLPPSLFALCPVPAAASAADVPPGATWTQRASRRPTGCAARRHPAPDWLRPSDKTPFILSIALLFLPTTPADRPAGPAENTSYDPLSAVDPGLGPLPSTLIKGATQPDEEGLQYMMVDLRGLSAVSTAAWTGPALRAFRRRLGRRVGPKQVVGDRRSAMVRKFVRRADRLIWVAQQTRPASTRSSRRSRLTTLAATSTRSRPRSGEKQVTIATMLVDAFASTTAIDSTPCPAAGTMSNDLELQHQRSTTRQRPC